MINRGAELGSSGDLALPSQAKPSPALGADCQANDPTEDPTQDLSILEWTILEWQYKKKKLEWAIWVIGILNQMVHYWR